MKRVSIPAILLLAALCLSGCIPPQYSLGGGTGGGYTNTGDDDGGGDGGGSGYSPGDF